MALLPCVAVTFQAGGAIGITQSPGPFGGPEDAGDLVAGTFLDFDSAFFAIVTLPRHAILLARLVLTGFNWGRNS